MRRITSILLILASLPFQILCSLTPLKVHAASSIIIEEVAWAGSSTSTADEWIELANLSDTDASIGGWTLKGAGASDKDIQFPTDAIIPSRGTYLIANYAETDTKSALASVIQVATTTVSLSNNAIRIELFDADNRLIDTAGDGNTPSAGSTNPTASMIRTDATIPGDQSSAWMTATTARGFKSGISDFGTPGYCDLCHATNTTIQDSSSTSDTTISNTSDATTSTIRTTPDATPTSTSTSQSETYVPRPTSYVLNEIVSNPSSGSEWIEIFVDEDIATTTDREILLFDGQGKIATIATGTTITIPPYLIIQLPSAKLNNGGDSLTLKEADGTIIETISIPALDKGQSYAKNPETDIWETTDTLTPAAENIIYHTPSPVRTTPSTAQTSTSITSTIGATSGVTPTSTSTSQLETYVLRPTSYVLNEVVSNPSSGPEWMELYTTSTATSTDQILKLHDSKSIIKTVPAGTPLTLPHYLVIPLSGSKLTNSGEDLSLMNASGTVIEATTIPKLAKNESWIKTSDGSWKITTILTPAAENKSSEPEDTTSDDASVLPTSIQTSDSSADEVLDDIMTAAEESNAEPQSVKLAATSKTSDVVVPHTFLDMFDESLNGIRARINGTVASVPKLFGASHVFILQNEDGRGLIVYLPTQLHAPTYGSTVRVDGTLSLTDYGPQFKMKKTDGWTTIPTSTTPQPRIVDLLAPGMEDAWSLMRATGTVTAVGTTSITIETEDPISLTILTPAATKFRTKRLVKGDVITVTGLVDIKKTTPTIMIRTPEDISLVKHADATVTKPESISPASTNRFPNWVPFASAGAAIVGTGGAKRLREEMRKRKLRKMMKRTGNEQS